MIRPASHNGEAMRVIALFLVVWLALGTVVTYVICAALHALGGGDDEP